MQAFDHFAISAATLDAGAAHVAAHLDVEIGPGGKHALMGTHNRLSGLGSGEYAEVIAVDPEAAPLDRPRWFDLDRRSGPPRIGNWILRSDNLDAVLERFPMAGRSLAFERGDFRWRMAVPDNGILPFDGCFPAVIQWDSAPPTFPDIGLRLINLQLQNPEAADLRKILTELVEDDRITLTQGPREISAKLNTTNGVRVIR